MKFPEKARYNPSVNVGGKLGDFQLGENVEFVCVCSNKEGCFTGEAYYRSLDRPGGNKRVNIIDLEF